MNAAPSWERLTALATLGTARAGVRVDELWPDPTLRVEGSQEQSLLRAAAATHLWLLAGQRVMGSARDNSPSNVPSNIQDRPLTAASVADAPPQLREIAAWRLGRML